MTWLRGALPAALAVGWLTGCQCTPSLPPPPLDDTQEPEPTGSTAMTADTGPEPPCAVPEVEPNDSEDEAVALPLEQRACGTLEKGLDNDCFDFLLDDFGWILVEVEGDDGSIADVQFTMGSRDDGWTVSKKDDTESTDASVVFEAPEGDYFLCISEEGLRGGPRYTYQALVSEAKAPVEWTREEVEPNDAFDAPESIVSGEAVFGLMDGNGALEDFDWYLLVVPPGRHDVIIDVDGFSFGSAADTLVNLWDEDLEKIREIRGGDILANEPDPEWVYDSPGDEILYLQVIEEDGKESPASWYVLGVELEAE